PTEIRNCILWGNTALEGAQLLLDSGFNNPAIVSIDFCDLQGGAADVAIDSACCSPSQLLFGENNLDTDPLFLDPATGEYHLAAESPAINAGDPGFVAAADETDIDGDPRVVGAVVDLGADEFRHPADINGDCAVNVLDVIELLLVFGGSGGPADINGDGSVNVVDLIELLLAFGSTCP
ncbi:MAG: choice-of-anchor Q domain-containing protein, partial [Planctomycetota bacterium]